jgi:hypothetical protein
VKISRKDFVGDLLGHKNLDITVYPFETGASFTKDAKQLGHFELNVEDVAINNEGIFRPRGTDSALFGQFMNCISKKLSFGEAKEAYKIYKAKFGSPKKATKSDSPGTTSTPKAASSEKKSAFHPRHNNAQAAEDDDDSSENARDFGAMASMDESDPFDITDDDACLAFNAIRELNDGAASTPGRMVYTPCTINGRLIRALVDSGASVTLMSEKLADELELARIPSVSQQPIASELAEIPVQPRSGMVKVELANGNKHFQVVLELAPLRTQALVIGTV